MDGSKLSTSQLLDSVAVMDESYAILSAGWYTDALRNPHAYSMLHNELARYTSKPVYQIMDQGASNMNYIGGYFIDLKTMESLFPSPREVGRFISLR